MQLFTQLMPDEIPPTPTPGELPPAAVVVTKSPRELELETELAAAREAQRQAELTAAEHEDRARQLIEIDSRRPAPAAKPKKAKPFFSTILHESEDED
jgi:hypothetical protein